MSLEDAFKCVKDGNLSLLKELLSKGVAWNSLLDGKSLGEVALENGYQEIYDFLVQEGNSLLFLYKKVLEQSFC